MSWLDNGQIRLGVHMSGVFVEGVAAQLFRDQALTVAFSLVVSLVVALTVLGSAFLARGLARF